MELFKKMKKYLERVIEIVTRKRDSSSHNNLYLPLSQKTRQIRLLTILAGQGNEPIVCSLRQVKLKTLRTYETISYCWGDSEDQCTITVNGHSISVTANAGAALRRVRRPHASRVVWIDAVCINQQDREERGHQVAIMGDVYRHGSCNLIFLSEENHERAISDIKVLFDEVTADSEGFPPWRNKAGDLQFSDTPINAAYDTKSLVAFYRAPWFRRLWVLQEAILAKTNVCLCGALEISLLEVTRVASSLLYKTYSIGLELWNECTGAAELNELVDRLHGIFGVDRRAPISVLYMLRLSQARHATEAVDKVYALLGLNMSPQIDIVPDYTKSAAEVFRDTTRCLIESSGVLNILEEVTHNSLETEPILEGFPSWVVRWDHSWKETDTPAGLSKSFDASTGKTLSLLVNPQPDNDRLDILAAAGLKIDRIRSRTQQLDQTSKSLFFASLCAILEEVEGLARETSHGESMTHDQRIALATTMVGGIDHKEKPVTSDVCKGYDALREQLSQGVLPPKLIKIRKNLDDNKVVVRAAKYGDAMYGASSNRCFFVTETGYLGLGPHFLRNGDMVAILYGLKWPAILRPVGMDGQYHFLGLAYVHGIMHGEALRQHEAAGGEDDAFFIV